MTWLNGCQFLQFERWDWQNKVKIKKNNNVKKKKKFSIGKYVQEGCIDGKGVDYRNKSQFEIFLLQYFYQCRIQTFFEHTVFLKLRIG